MLQREKNNICNYCLELDHHCVVMTFLKAVIRNMCTVHVISWLRGYTRIARSNS